MAPRARFELATLRLTAEMVEILNALYGVAYRQSQMICGPSVGLLGLPNAVGILGDFGEGLPGLDGLEAEPPTAAGRTIGLLRRGI